MTLKRQTPRFASSTKPGKCLVLRVHDNGMCIPPEILDRIIDPFFTDQRRRMAGRREILALAKAFKVWTPELLREKWRTKDD